jgi:hypothetical protein
MEVLYDSECQGEKTKPTAGSIANKGIAEKELEDGERGCSITTCKPFV